MAAESTTASVEIKPKAGGLAALPLVANLSVLARNRGWAYVITWGHRLSGWLLIAYALFHIYTLSALTNPADYDAKMQLFGSPIFMFLEWALAIPVILHAFNGGRLILFELFGVRDDEGLVRWALGLAGVYVVFLGLIMIMGGQSVSPVFYWLYMTLLAVIAAGVVSRKIWRVKLSLFWKLQRITAAYLLVMIPAHFILSHLSVAASHEAAQVVARMQLGFVKIIDISLVLGLLYHAAYGLISMVRDYLASRAAAYALTIIIAAVFVLAAFFALRLTVAV